MTAGGPEPVTEIRQQSLPAAGAALRELSHHVDPGPLDGLVPPRLGERESCGVHRRRRPSGAAQTTVRELGQRSHFLQQRDQLREFARREAAATSQLGPGMWTFAQHRDDVTYLNLRWQARAEVPLEGHVF